MKEYGELLCLIAWAKGQGYRHCGGALDQLNALTDRNYKMRRTQIGVDPEPFYVVYEEEETGDQEK